MPRLTASNANVYDFCVECFPTYKQAVEGYGDLGDGPDERGNCFFMDDEEHPTYEYTDYKCEICGKPLTQEDN